MSGGGMLPPVTTAGGTNAPGGPPGPNNAAGGAGGAAGGPPTHFVYFFDGTGNDRASTAQSETNVSRLQRCIAQQGRNGVPQVTFYMRGIGTTGSTISDTLAQAVAGGIDDNIKNAYRTLSTRMRRGDMLSAFGFSRGAFTARCLIDLVCRVGLYQAPTPAQAPAAGARDPVDTLYQIWAQSAGPRTALTIPPGLAGQILSPDQLQVQICGVWDTVASVGPPHTRGVPLAAKRLQFMEEPPVRLKVALHALSLLEHRENFEARVWEQRADPQQILKQTWFYGFHADVGGGADVLDSNLVNLALVWMAAEVQTTGLLAIDHAQLDSVLLEQPGNPVGGSQISDSRTILYRLPSSISRRPGTIRADTTNSIVADPQHRSLQTIHMSVRLLTSLTAIQIPKDTILDELFSSRPATTSSNGPGTTPQKYVARLPRGPPATELSEAAPTEMEQDLWVKIRRGGPGTGPPPLGGVGGGGGGQRGFPDFTPPPPPPPARSIPPPPPPPPPPPNNASSGIALPQRPPPPTRAIPPPPPPPAGFAASGSARPPPPLPPQASRPAGASTASGAPTGGYFPDASRLQRLGGQLHPQ